MKSSAALRACAMAALIALGVWCGPVAQADTVSFGDAPLVSTSAAFTYFNPGSLTSPTRDADPLITRTAHALGDDADRIYAFVHDNIDVIPMFGVQKGARGALIDKAGTPFDQAQLLAELLRAAGYAVTYRLGTRELSHAEVLTWLGTDNATAVSNILADGGIPADITSADGVVSSATIVHIWVAVTISGASCAPCLFDPSFQDRTARTGTLDAAGLDSAMGFGASTFMSTGAGGAMNGVTTSTSGAPQLSGFNGTNARASMQTYSSALLTYIRSNYASADLEGVVGGSDIVADASVHRDASLANHTSVQTYSNDIPDAFALQLTLSFTGGFTTNKRLDEIYGQELVAVPNIQVPISGTQTFKLYLNGTQIGSTYNGISVTLSVAYNHPYAASATGGSPDGSYLDHTDAIGGSLNAGAYQFFIGAGRMTSDYGAFLDARSTGTESHIDYCCASEEYAPTNSQRATKRRYGASLAAQLGSAMDLERRIGAASIVVHDLLIGAGSRAIFTQGHGGTPSASMAQLEASMSLSANANNADSGQTLALRRAAAALSATLEASAVQQNMDSVYSNSTAARFDWASSGANGAGHHFYWANASNWTYVSGQIQDNYNSGSPIRTAAQTAVNAGYSVIVPESSNLGPGDATISGCGFPPCSLVGPERGGALIAIASASIIHEITAYNGQPLSGAAGTNDAESNPLHIFSVPEDFLQRQYSSRAEAYSVDLNTGVVSYTAPPDMVVGEGDYPYSLSYQRSFRSGTADIGAHADPNYVLNQGPQSFGDSGWSSNFDHYARAQNDGADAFGMRSPREATDTIAAIRVLIALSADQGSDLGNLQYLVGGMHVMAWWGEQLQFNAIDVAQGQSHRTFFQLADGTFSGPPGDSTQIAVNGSRIIYNAPIGNHAAVRLWLYNGLCVQETAHDGSVSYYGRWNTGYSACQSPVNDNYVPDRGMRFRHQVFLQGVVVDFDDVTLSNNLGRQLSVTTPGASSAATYTVRDGGPTSTLRTATLLIDQTYDTNAGPGKLSATGTDANTWVYDGLTDAAHWSVFAPTSSTVAIARFDYQSGTNATVETLTDGCRTAATCAANIIPPPSSYLGNVTQYYISTGRIGATTDALAHQSRVYYDQNGLPIRSVDRLGNETRTQYDAFHRPTDVYHPEGNYEHTDYDVRNNPTDVYRHPKPGSSLSTIHTSAAYDATCGIPTSETDGNANTTTYTLLSGRCLISQMSQPAVDDGTTSSNSLVNPITGYTWNSLGQRLTRTDPTSIVTTNAYDATSHYLTSVTVASGTLNLATSFGRDSYGDINSVTDPNSHVFTGTYDTSRRLTQFNGPSGTNVQTLWHYNQDGQIADTQQATGNASPHDYATTTYTYLPTGRVATVADPLTHTTNYYYDQLARSIAVVDPMSRRSETSYDAEGHVTQERRAVGSAVQINYATRTWTANGMLNTVSDANSNLSSFTYDGFDRLDRLYFPSTTLGSGTSNTSDYEAYTYDPNSNRTQVRLRSGDSDTITTTYDALNREIFRDLSSGSSTDVSSRYDLAGRRVLARFGTSVTPATGCTTNNNGVDYCYDQAGRLTSETSYGRRLQFQFDNASNRTRITFPDSNYFTYDYDAMNRVTAVRENGASSGAGVLDTYVYDRMSRRMSQTRGQSQTSHIDTINYTYNDDSSLTNLVTALSGSGNDANFTFGYNADHQITSRTFNPTYEYNIPTTSLSYTRNGLNQYTAISSASLTYDARGNLTGDGSRLFCYDLENHLTGEAASGGNACSSPTYALSYDPLGRLHSTTASGTATELLYDGDRLVGEYTSSGTMLRRYVHGPGVDEPIVWYEGSALTDRRHLITDRQGSIAAVDGATVDRYQYGAYGEPNTWSGSRFRYTGQIALPEVQLYHHKARVYDPVLGRFLQTDPVGYRAGLNLYVFVGDDPLNGTDPGGLCRRDAQNECVVETNVSDASNQAGVTAAAQRLQTAVRRVDHAINALPNNARVAVIGRNNRVIGTISGRDLKRAWNRENFTVTDRNYGTLNGGAGSSGGGNVEVAASTVSGYDAAAGDAGLNYLALHETGHNSRGGRSFFSAESRAYASRTGSNQGFYNETDVGGYPTLVNPEAIANEQYANSFAESVGDATGVDVFQQPYGRLP